MGVSEGLTKGDVELRVVNVCKAFDKITADKVSLDSHFINDLGLDSLDHVEVIMAIEDEFGFEIPDEHAEKLLTPAKITKYVCDHEKIHMIDFKDQEAEARNQKFWEIPK